MRISDWSSDVCSSDLLKLNSPQIRVNIDREKAADLGIPVANIGRTLETMLGSRQVTRFKREGKQYDVILQLADVDRRNSDDLKRIHVRASGGDRKRVV